MPPRRYSKYMVLSRLCSGWLKTLTAEGALGAVHFLKKHLQIRSAPAPLQEAVELHAASKVLKTHGFEPILERQVENTDRWRCPRWAPFFFTPHIRSAPAPLQEAVELHAASKVLTNTQF